MMKSKILLVAVSILLCASLCACSAEKTPAGAPGPAPTAQPTSEPLADVLMVDETECKILSATAESGKVTVVISCPMGIGVDPGSELGLNVLLEQPDGTQTKADPTINVRIDGENFEVTLTFEVQESIDRLVLAYKGQRAGLPAAA